jgi:transcriptional regulator with XRE-family HTH domain
VAGGAERMTPEEFKTWRKTLGLSQKKAADALGLKNRIVQYYEKGERDGERVKIPKHVRLACYALSIGVGDYHGPGSADGAASGKGHKRQRKRKRDAAEAAAATPEAG